jgi:hypothetical protein
VGRERERCVTKGDLGKWWWRGRRGVEVEVEKRQRQIG